MHLFLKNGWVEVITGPMFSGKTEELIKRLTTLKFAKQKFVSFKPQIDTRWRKEEITSRAGSSINAITILTAEEALKFIEEDTYAVAFDEAQFFDKSIIPTVNKLANKGIRVMVAGLDLDVFREPFGEMSNLMSRAEFVTKLKAVCFKCAGVASFSYRKKGNSGNQIEIGDKIYEARCRKDIN